MPDVPWEAWVGLGFFVLSAVAFGAAVRGCRFPLRTRRRRPLSEWETFLDERLAAGRAIERRWRAHRDDVAWLRRAVGDWETENLCRMAGHDRADRPTGTALAPELVESYRRNPKTGMIGYPPPYGAAEYLREFRRQLAWLKRQRDHACRGRRIVR